jgi:hypothetical protein
LWKSSVLRNIRFARSSGARLFSVFPRKAPQAPVLKGTEKSDEFHAPILNRTVLQLARKNHRRNICNDRIWKHTTIGAIQPVSLPKTSSVSISPTFRIPGPLRFGAKFRQHCVAHDFSTSPHLQEITSEAREAGEGLKTASRSRLPPPSTCPPVNPRRRPRKELSAKSHVAEGQSVKGSSTLGQYGRVIF